MSRIVCLIGAKRTGKDTVGEILCERWDFARITTGDTIKADLDAAIKARFGFSAFTEVNAEKDEIRQVLLDWGAAAADYIIPRLIRQAAESPCSTVNTRVCRLEEMQLWTDAGAELWLVTRPGHEPFLEERDAFAEAIRRGWVKRWIHNDGSFDGLAAQVRRAVEAYP